MAYTKTNWVNLETELNPDNMNHIEEGVENSYGQFLIAVSDTAPLECSTGDKYYNTTSNKIFTAVGSDTWDSTGEDAELGVFYIVLETQNIYTYDGETLVSVGGGSGSGGGENIPIGTISAFAGNTAPTGYLMCDGSAVSRTTYSELFTAIGTTYGAGDDSTTFNLPNIKGRTIVMQDTSDNDFDTLGKTGGSKTVTLTVDQMPSHTHSLRTAVTAGSNTQNDKPLSAAPSSSWNNNAHNELSIDLKGGGQPHNNLQPYIVLNYIIKASMTTGTTSEVVNDYSTSQENTYSCDYVNNLVEDVYSTTETKTGKKWIDGKDIYRKVIVAPGVMTTNNWITLESINNAETLTYGIMFLRDDNNDIGAVWNEVMMRINNNNVQYYQAVTELRHSYTGAIIEYTKTTD